MEVVVSRGGRFITPRLGVDFSHEVYQDLPGA